MLILEGCDCSGKSTLATALAVRYHAPVTHYSAHEEAVMLKHAELCRPGTGEIVDRFHLSEPPYSMYLRHELPAYSSVERIDNLLLAGNNLVILCIPPWEVVYGMWKQRLDAELVQNEKVLRGIYKWYDEKAETRYKTPHMRYDYTMDSITELFDSIDEVLGDG